jgi:hypothetical protein
MEKTDPHKKYNYSHDYLVMTALVQELNHLKLNKKYDNVRDVVEEYMRGRVKEIKERWK